MKGDAVDRLTAKIVQAICECPDPAYEDEPDSLCIKVSDLTNVIEGQLELWSRRLADDFYKKLWHAQSICVCGDYVAHHADGVGTCHVCYGSPDPWDGCEKYQPAFPSEGLKGKI